MKLAEALQERADLNRRIEQLRIRLDNNILVQEGEKPAEDPKDLKKELDGCIDRLCFLIAAINRTNSATVIEGRTLTDLIAEKDTLTLKISAYRDMVESAGRSAIRARGTEIRIIPVISAAALQKEADQLAKKLRQTDNLIQENNWKTELIEK
ncbi:MAG TPA: hypothetical protein DHW39_03275 [Erysipelotrichaceae bacterium]|nr:hypothetical protein [Erysipelotrichaceae bacterium]